MFFLGSVNFDNSHRQGRGGSGHDTEGKLNGRKIMSTTCQFDSTAVPVSRPPARIKGTSHTVMQINILFIANTVEVSTAQRLGNGTKKNWRIGVLFQLGQRSFSSALRLDWLLVSRTFPVTGHREKPAPEESTW